MAFEPTDSFAYLKFENRFTNDERKKRIDFYCRVVILGISISSLIFFFVISFPEVINGRQSSLPVNYHRVDMQRYTNATRWNHHQIVTSLLIDDDRRMLRTWIYQRQSTLIELTSWIATRSSEASAVISRNWHFNQVLLFSKIWKIWFNFPIWKRPICKFKLEIWIRFGAVLIFQINRIDTTKLFDINPRHRVREKSIISTEIFLEKFEKLKNLMINWMKLFNINRCISIFWYYKSTESIRRNWKVLINLTSDCRSEFLQLSHLT